MNFLNRIVLATKLMFGREEKAAGAAGGQIGFIGDSQYGKPQRSSWNAKASTDALKASTWLYSGVSMIAEAFSSVPVRVEKWDPKTQQWVADPEHPAQLLLDRPNPVQTLQYLKERWAYHVVLAGNALWYLNTGNSDAPTARILEVWALNPHEMAPIPDRSNWVLGYEYKPEGGKKEILPASKVAHWMLTDPLNPYWGLSKLQAAARAVDTDIAAANWNIKVLQNDGRPPFAIIMDSKLTPQQAQKAREILAEQNTGPQNARRFFLAAGATDIKPLALSAADMDWLAGREFSREEIGAVIGVPSILMAAGQNVTFTNLEAAERIFWQKTVAPLLNRFCEGLTLTILPHFGATGTHRVAPDFSGVVAMQESLRDRAETAKVLIDAGFPMNEVNDRLQLGFKPIKGGDVPFANRLAVPAPAPTASKSRQVKDDDLDTEGVATGSDKEKLSWEEEMTKRLVKILGEDGTAIAEAYLTGGWEKVARANQQDLLLVLTAMHKTIIEAVGAETYAALTSLAGLNAAFDVLDPAVVAWVNERSLESAKSITDTRIDAARAVIAAGTKEGLSNKEIARNLREKFSDLDKTQAETIATTEVHAAYANANHLAADQFSQDHNIPMRKRWRAAGDSRTRDTHKSLNGRVVEMDEDFKPNLAYPHDPRAPAAEVIRCRCVVQYLPVLQDE